MVSPGNRNRFGASPGSSRIARRRFLKAAAMAPLMIWGQCPWLPYLGDIARAGLFTDAPPQALLETAPEARYWIAANADRADCLACHTPKEGISGASFQHEKAFVQCQLCARNCIIPSGGRGECRARYNDGGRLKTLVYGHPVSVHVDPIEKKPFYHFLPGSAAFSLATTGCPLRCKFCQNWEISQAKPEDIPTEWVAPGRIVAAALDRRSPVVAFTYNEPTVFTEYLLDIAAQGKARGLRSALISCGFMNPAPLADMCGALSAIKVDLKGYDPAFYRDVCGAELDPVLRTIRQVRASGVHLEIVNLVVPTLNDSEPMLSGLIRWVMDELGPDVPIHFTRFMPNYQMRNLPPTPVSTLERAYEMARTAGIRYPYVGNVPGHPGNHTCCPQCGKIVIQRQAFFVTAIEMDAGRCRFCQTPIAGVWS